MAQVKENNCKEAWESAIALIINEGSDHYDGSRDFRQVLNLNLEIENPHDDIIYPSKKLKECDKWLYPDVNEMRNIILSKKINPGYTFTYGQRIFNFNEQIDQVDDYIIPQLKTDESTRTAVITLWNPMVDCKVAKKPKPGLVMCTMKLINKELIITSIIRNNDIFIGWPATLYQISELQEYVAEKINAKKGKLVFYSTTAHIYKENFTDVKELLRIS